MPVEVIMPMLGMAQETGKVVRWLKAEGDQIAKAEPLMEVETDKVTVEIEAPAAGTLAGVAASEGDDVPVGQVIAYVLGDGEQLPEPDARSAPVVALAAEPAMSGGQSPGHVGNGPETGSSPASAVARPAGAATSGGLSPGHVGNGQSSRRTLASPKARRLARERGVPIEEIAGSGPYGAVQAADVQAFEAAAPASPPRPDQSSAWRTMARRMSESWRDVPHFYLSREVDATRLNAWRDIARTRAGYEHVTHTDLLVKIAAAALAEHPLVNRAPEVNVGIAVATDDALVVPVIHGADRLELRAVTERRAELVARARERKLRLEDVKGGTFTISNLGMFGVDAFGAIVNAPEAAILAVGRITDRVVAVDGVPAVRPTFVLTLSLDHRAIDGAIGARFLDTLVSLVEEPAGLVN
jgi:pyruvate dehydrogenase E2 component (dihydrolipoyllysine-residue acetyltransferase)